MSTTVGNDGAVTVGGAAPGETARYSVNESADPVEDTALGDTNRTHKPGLATIEGSIEVHWDKGDAQQTSLYNALASGATIVLVLMHEGIASGKARWTVSVTVIGVETAVEFNEIVNSTLRWTAQGTLVKDTQP